MKKIVVLLFLANLSFSVAQQNIVKNGNFKETIFDFTSKIKRLDIQYGAPKDWKSISMGFVILLGQDVDWATVNTISEKHERILKKSIETLEKDDVVVGLLIGKQTPNFKTTREYIVGKLKYTLLKGRKYHLKIKVFLPNFACYGLKSIGVKLEEFYPNCYDHTPREDVNAINFILPDSMNKWIELDTVITAKGNEKFIIIGSFEKEENLLVFQKYRDRDYIRNSGIAENAKIIKKKKPCPEKWGQDIFISNINIEALDSSEWALLEPQQDSLQIDSTSILSQEIPQKPVQDYQKNYQANFAKNSYAIEAEMLQEVLNDLQELEEKNSNYHLYLTGHTDDEGSIEANEKLSQQRAEALQSWLLENNTNAKQITIDYKGKRALLGADAAKNRRVEIRLEYQAIERVLEE